MQKTFFIIKPDAVKRHLIGQVLDRIERRGFVIERMEMLMLDEERLREHYAQLVDKPFFPSIAEFMMSGPAVIGIMSGPGVIKSWRDMMGATNPGDATPGTIRGDFASTDGDMIPNIVHGSDSDESAAQIRFGLVVGWF
ncbi:MAG: nucleoside-diphosphate kinase [Streptococcus salivarius]